MALAMQKSYDSFCSEWADFKAILVKRKDENGWTLAKVVSWSSNVSITGYAKELRTLPLNWGIAVLKKEGFFRYASSMTNGQNFRCFPLKIKIGLCVSWILFFFWSCEVLRIFLLAWGEKWTDDDESVVCPRRPPESRLRWTLNLHFSTSTRQYFCLENQALHMEMERTHEFLPEEFFDAPDSSDEACFRMTNCSTETLQTSIFDNWNILKPRLIPVWQEPITKDSTNHPQEGSDK